MTRIKTMLLPALALTGCAAPGEAVPPPPAPITDVATLPADCALSIRFGSFAMGIDRGAAKAIEALLVARPGVAVTRQRWGREGEYTLCVQAPAAEALALAKAMAPLIPPRPRGPIEVELADGTSFGTSDR
jgi:hypothetical protein